LHSSGPPVSSNRAEPRMEAARDEPLLGRGADLQGPEPERADLGNVVFFCILGGLCKMVPALDDFLVYFVRRHMVSSQLRKLPTLQGVGVRVLSQPPRLCLRCARKCVYFGCCCCWWELLCHVLCFAWTLKEGVDVASTLLHEGWLIAYALKAGHLNEITNSEDLWRIRQAMTHACDVVDTSPITQILKKAFSGSKELLRHSARRLVEALRVHGVHTSAAPNPGAMEETLDELEGEERAELRGLQDALAEALGTQKPYFRQLGIIFEQKMGKLKAEGAKPAWCAAMLMGGR